MIISQNVLNWLIAIFVVFGSLFFIGVFPVF